jgi:chromosome partitioning protein
MKMSRALRDRYAVLFLDCPPGISLLSENVLRAADAVIVPLIPTPLSVRMLEQLRDFTAANGWTDLRLLPFFSMVDRRKSLHHEVIEGCAPRFAELLDTEVPYWSGIERMTLLRAPLPSYAPHSPAGESMPRSGAKSRCASRSSRIRSAESPDTLATDIRIIVARLTNGSRNS